MYQHFKWHQQMEKYCQFFVKTFLSIKQTQQKTKKNNKKTKNKPKINCSNIVHIFSIDPVFLKNEI